MARQFSEFLPDLGEFYDAIAEPPAKVESLDDLLAALKGDAKQVVQAICDWAPTYANALKDVPALTTAQENPARRNLENLHQIRDAIDQSGALKIETAARRLPKLAIQAAVTAVLTQILPPQYQAQALIILFPILQALGGTFADQIFPDASRQATLWRRVHEHIVHSSKPLLAELPEDDQEALAATDRNLRQAIGEFSRNEQPTTAISNYKEVYQALALRQQYFFTRPTKMTNYLDNFNQAAFYDYLKNKPRELQVLYQTVVHAIIMKSVLPAPPQQRLQFLFWGYPGVGKDTLIKLICTVIGARIYEIDYKELEEARKAHYSNAAKEKITSALHANPKVTTDNPLADTVREAGCQNPIILLPELNEKFARDGMMMSVLNTMLDPNTEPPHAVIFATTNTPPAQLNQALVNRFICVYVPPPNDVERQAHAEQQFDLINSALQARSPYTADPDITSQLRKNRDRGYRTIQRNTLLINGYLHLHLLNNTQPDRDDLKMLFQALDAPKLDTDDSNDDDSNSE